MEATLPTKQKPKGALELLVAPEPPALSLEQRARALLTDLFKAPIHEREDVISLWQQTIEDHLTVLDECRRPKTESGAIPAGWLKMLWFRQSAGCHCRAMLEADSNG
jgi:hypothetical protein